MLQMVWYIKIGNYRLGLLEAVKIHRSVDLLADTAEITLPAVVQNKALDLEEKIGRGDEVTIQLGYDGELREEFAGYLLEISVSNGNITLVCEDNLYLFRKPLADRELKNVSLEKLLEEIVREMGLKLKVCCSYDFVYDKFVISRSTGYDVLKKVQEETKANIYMKQDTVHLHPAYEEVFGQVKYDFARNVETDGLTYRRAEEQKFEVEVAGLTKGGQSVKVVVGTTGGDRKSVKVYGVTDREQLKKRGEEELKYLTYDGYEGDFTGWLLPYCDAGYVAELRDEEYPQKNGSYYVTAVTTEFSRNGGSRRVQVGKKAKGELK